MLVAATNPVSLVLASFNVEAARIQVQIGTDKCFHLNFTFEKSETCEIIHVQKNVMHFLSHCVLLRDLEFIPFLTERVMHSCSESKRKRDTRVKTDLN